MKTLILKNWMMALLLTGACCGLVACDNDDDNTPPPAPNATAVMGDYNGTMSTLQLTPTEGEGEEPAGTQVDATVTDTAIQFEDFPVRDLVIAVLGDEALADKVLEQIGKVNYSIPYTALMTEDKAGVTLTLSPEPLKLTLTKDSEAGGPESFEEPSTIEVEVEVIAQGDGAYTLESENMEFHISAASVKVAGSEMAEFEPLTLAFDLAKN